MKLIIQVREEGLEFIMINKIDKLTKIAKFENFTWDSKTDNFSKINIVFGYNGSGKTAISNVFRLFSKQSDIQSNELFKELSHDEDSIVEITLDGTKKKYGSAIDKKDIYVFNPDFITDHVYDGTSANLKEFDSSVVTQEQLKNPEIIKFEKEINDLGKENKSKNDKKELLENKFEEIKAKLSKELNDKISGTRFHTVKGIPDIIFEKKESIARNKLDNVFSDYEMSGKREELKSDIEKLRELQFEKMKINLDSSSKVILKDILETSREKIKEKIDGLRSVKLKRTSSLNDWFEGGLEVLKSDSVQKEKICPLCNSNISSSLDNLIKDYEVYFSSEYKILIESLNNYIETVENDKKMLNDDNENLGEFEKYISKYEDIKEETKPSFVLDKVTILSSLNMLKKYLIEKKKNISFKRINLKFFEEFKEEISNYNNIITKIEEKHRILLKELEGRNYDPDSLKKEARDLCKDLLSIQFNSYTEGNQIHNYNQLKEEIASNNEKISKIDREKREKISSLKNESKYINYYLKRLGICNFTVDINKDNMDENIVINYQSGCIKNKIKHSVSEGEKTALAFAYFISKIKYEIFDNSQADIKETIVIIDDPISSLDESRLYSTACLINNLFSDAKQLFILSHNLVFLKFIGNLVGYPREENHKKEKVCCRRDYFLSMFGKLTELPYGLSNYQTMYFQKFDDIIKYKKGVVGYDDAKIYIPNHIRVILETFLSFKFFLLNKGSSGEKYLSPGLDKLIKQLESKTHLFRDYPKHNHVNKDNFLQKLEQIRRITDPQSHGTPQNIDKFNFISENELSSIVEDTLDIICFIDKIHYDEITCRSS